MMYNKKHRVRFAAAIAGNAAGRQEQQRGEETHNHEQPQNQSNLELTPETCRQLWYQNDEIHKMKSEIRDLVYRGQTKYGETEMGGLQRYNTERVRHKKEVMQYILKAYRKISYSKMNPKSATELLSKASQISTRWSKNVARYQAYKDHGAVYGYENNKNKINSAGNNAVLKRKQSTEPADHGSTLSTTPVAVCGRNVRQRTLPDNSQMLQRV